MTDTIPNKPLSGIELRQIIEADVDRILGMDAFMNEYTSYGRVSYVVAVKLLLDNPSFPEHTISVKAKGNKEKTVATSPVSEVSDTVIKAGRQRTRTINNPNLERLKHGLPITKDFIDPSDGKQKTQNLNYTAADAGLTDAHVDPENGTVDRELAPMEIDL